MEFGGRTVIIEQQSEFPRTGESVLTLKMSGSATFAIKIRVPAWAAPLTAGSATVKDGWAELPMQEWKDGDQINVKFNLAERVVAGEFGNVGRTATVRGPFVLARDLKTGTLMPFADAGADGGAYRVWLRKSAVGSDSLLADGVEGRSRPGNLSGSIIDGDFGSCVVTSGDKRSRNEHWFDVTLDAPVMIRRVVFAHGRSFHDGGWFVGKPKVQVQRVKDGAWEPVGELGDYPIATAADGSQLKPGQKFTLRLANPEKVLAVRVIGVPASGDNPQKERVFSSCAELQAFDN